MPLEVKQLTACIMCKHRTCQLQVQVQRLSATSFSVFFSCNMFTFFSGLHHPDPPVTATVTATVSSSKSPCCSYYLPTPVPSHVFDTLASRR